MKKLFVSFFAVAMVFALAVSSFAAAGDVTKVGSASESEFVGEFAPNYVV